MVIRLCSQIRLRLTLDYTQGCTLEVWMGVKQAGSMQIGQIAAQTGIGIDAIRFYERKGLLAAPARSEGGFRLYSSDDLSTLQFIRSLQMLGFSLTEVREFLSLRTNGLRACSAVRKMLRDKLKDVHAKRLALLELEDELKAALTKCNSQLKRPRRRKGVRCPVLSNLAKSKHNGAK